MVILREFHENDVESIVKYINNKNITDNLRDFIPKPYTIEDAKEFIEFSSKNKDTQLSLAIDLEGEAIGSISITLGSDISRKTAEIGYWLAEPFWGRGIMTEAISQMCKIAFSNYDIVRIFAGVFEYNKPSGAALEKNGFSLECVQKKAYFKNGKILNCLLYAKVID